MFEYAEMASDWEGAGLGVGGLGASVASPFGRTPSANHTLLCSRDRDPKKVHAHTSLIRTDRKVEGENKSPTAIFCFVWFGFFGCTLAAGLLQDSHGHHDGRRRGAEHPRGLGLLQRGDGGAVLGWVVGVRTLVACRGRRLPRGG